MQQEREREREREIFVNVADDYICIMGFSVHAFNLAWIHTAEYKRQIKIRTN